MGQVFQGLTGDEHRPGEEVIACALHIQNDTQQVRPGDTGIQVRKLRIRLSGFGTVEHPLLQNRGDPADQGHTLYQDLRPSQGIDHDAGQPFLSVVELQTELSVLALLHDVDSLVRTTAEPVPLSLSCDPTQYP